MLSVTSLLGLARSTRVRIGGAAIMQRVDGSNDPASRPIPKAQPCQRFREFTQECVKREPNRC